MNKFTRRGFVGSFSAATAATALAAQQSGALSQDRKTGSVPIKITDVKCAMIGNNPVVRIVTDQGVDGYGQASQRRTI